MTQTGQDLPLYGYGIATGFTVTSCIVCAPESQRSTALRSIERRPLRFARFRRRSVAKHWFHPKCESLLLGVGTFAPAVKVWSILIFHHQLRKPGCLFAFQR
ncbi:unnamed protein product [Cylicocyclus nassatus]|uniref:Uncharacterized protein n=1 Tax=Cylicocyclus nassatus TaxID=53992 RepID=A0AA36M5F7_CYLNA|nr:unnamed protein product [Cylicocyclus nassatus]